LQKPEDASSIAAVMPPALKTNVAPQWSFLRLVVKTIILFCRRPGWKNRTFFTT
jgi:hypothetical protein